MSGDPSSDPKALGLSVKLASRTVLPGDRAAGVLILSAASAARVTALRVVPTMTRRELEAGEVRSTSLPVSSGSQLGAYSVAAGANREIHFSVQLPPELATSVPNQLDYDLVATAVTDEGEVEARARVLVLPTEGGANMTLPIGPMWLAVGNECEAETDEGHWVDARIEGVHGLTALVRWRDAEPTWLPARRLRERSDR
ncbi:MAG: hypothetical protein R3A48_24305 [Polyangiales bacterium]